MTVSICVFGLGVGLRIVALISVRVYCQEALAKRFPENMHECSDILRACLDVHQRVGAGKHSTLAFSPEILSVSV